MVPIPILFKCIRNCIDILKASDVGDSCCNVPLVIYKNTSDTLRLGLEVVSCHKLKLINGNLYQELYYLQILGSLKLHSICIIVWFEIAINEG